MTEDTIPVDRNALLNLLDETFDVIEWLIPFQDHPTTQTLNLQELQKAHKALVADFEEWTTNQIKEDLSTHENVISIFTKLKFFKE